MEHKCKNCADYFKSMTSPRSGFCKSFVNLFATVVNENHSCGAFITTEELEEDIVDENCEPVLSNSD